MTVHEPANADRDWWTPHVLIAIFCALVAAILRAVPGWSMPLHAWITLAVFAIAALAAHAGLRAALAVAHRRWCGVAFALALAAGLVVAAMALLMFGRPLDVTLGEDVFGDAPIASARRAR